MKQTKSTLRIGAVAFAAALLASCGGAKDDVTEAAEDAASAVEEVVTDATDATTDAMEDTVTEVADGVEGVVEEATDAAEGAVEDATDAVEGAVEEAKDTMSEASSASASTLVEKCVAEGETEEVCNCQIGAIEEALGEDNFSELVSLAMKDDEEGAEQLMTDILTAEPEVAMSMSMKMLGCSEG